MVKTGMESGDTGSNRGCLMWYNWLTKWLCGLDGMVLFKAFNGWNGYVPVVLDQQNQSEAV